MIILFLLSKTFYSVESYSLDILSNKNIIENISLLHIDVEGQELAVIKGSINLITKYNPIIIFEGHIKTNTSQVISCCDFLKNINYNLFIINEYAGNPGDCRNFLCIPTNKITEFNKNFDFMNFITNVTNEYNYKLFVNKSFNIWIYLFYNFIF